LSHWKATCRAPAYSRALRQIRLLVQMVVYGGGKGQVARGDSG